MIKLAYLISLLGKNNDAYIPMAGVVFATSEEEALGLAMNRFKSSHPNFGVVSHIVELLILDTSVQIEDGYLFKNS